MARIKRLDASIRIRASRQAVWNVLSSLDAPAGYDPTVSAARIVSTETEGIGSTRELHLANSDILRESVSAWKPERFLDLHTSVTSMPIESLDRNFTLDDEGESTRVTLQAEYRPKYGPLGAIIDYVFLGNRLRRVHQAGLYALKRQVELQNPF